MSRQQLSPADMRTIRGYYTKPLTRGKAVPAWPLIGTPGGAHLIPPAYHMAGVFAMLSGKLGGYPMGKPDRDRVHMHWLATAAAQASANKLWQGWIES